MRFLHRHRAMTTDSGRRMNLMNTQVHVLFEDTLEDVVYRRQLKEISERISREIGRTAREYRKPPEE
jgi:hypothetical protein